LLLIMEEVDPLLFKGIVVGVIFTMFRGTQVEKDLVLRHQVSTLPKLISLQEDLKLQGVTIDLS